MSASVELGGWGRIRSLIEAAMASKAFPGAVVGIAWPSGIEEVGAFGRLTYAEEARPVTADTLYDLASLTKVVATTSVVMRLVEEGKLDLAQNVSSILPAFGGGDKGRITVEHLLTHASGLPVHAPFYRDWRGREGLVERIAELSLCDEPGVRSAYSDVGFLLLGEIVEGALGERLEHVVPRMVLAPLGMGSTLYHPAPQLWEQIAPTEVCPWRGRLLIGEVHDENAFVLGGAAAHAGLFGTAGDLLRFSRMMLRGGCLGDVRLFAPETVRRFTQRCDVPGSTRALGWDTADLAGAMRSSTPGAPGYSSAGRVLSPRSFGHTGFTGTSLWIDPDRELALVLLTNRVHPDRCNDAIRGVRSALADMVAEEHDARRVRPTGE